MEMYDKWVILVRYIHNTDLSLPSPLIRVKSCLLPGTGEGDNFTNGNFLYKRKTYALFLEIFQSFLLLNCLQLNDPFAKLAYFRIVHAGALQAFEFLIVCHNF